MKQACLSLCVFLMSSCLAAAQSESSDATVSGNVTRLLAELKDLQDSGQSGQDPWAQKMKELIELGPEAVPSLIKALDETPFENRRMLRSLPFILRGIGDKRAIPVLIKTIPKCAGSDGSDMGYNSQDKELLAFMRKHDNRVVHRDADGYAWGRPVNEVRTALDRLMGEDLGLIEIVHVHSGRGTTRQRFLKKALFYRCAEDYAKWWEANWKNRVKDARYSVVKLPVLESTDELKPVPRDAVLKTDSSSSNMILESVYRKKANRVFYDLDTGRTGSVHRRWRGKVTQKNAGIVSKWAASRGYDLMGSEQQKDGKTIWTLELIAGDAWQVPYGEWKNYRPQTAKALIEKGRKLERMLTIVKPNGAEPDLRATGAIYVITREGTPMLMHLGVEVHDTKVKYGEPARGDLELKPTHFVKGRRFGLKFLAEQRGE